MGSWLMCCWHQWHVVVLDHGVGDVCVAFNVVCVRGRRRRRRTKRSCCCCCCLRDGAGGIIRRGFRLRLLQDSLLLGRPLLLGSSPGARGCCCRFLGLGARWARPGAGRGARVLPLGASGASVVGGIGVLGVAVVAVVLIGRLLLLLLLLAAGLHAHGALGL